MALSFDYWCTVFGAIFCLCVNLSSARDIIQTLPEGDVSRKNAERFYREQTVWNRITLLSYGVSLKLYKSVFWPYEILYLELLLVTVAAAVVLVILPLALGHPLVEDRVGLGLILGNGVLLFFYRTKYPEGFRSRCKYRRQKY